LQARVGLFRQDVIAWYYTPANWGLETRHPDHATRRRSILPRSQGAVRALMAVVGLRTRISRDDEAGYFLLADKAA